MNQGVTADVVVLLVDADLTRWDDGTLRVDDAGHVERRHAERLEGARLDVDLDLAEDAAEDGGGAQPLDAGEVFAEAGVGEVEEVAVVARVARDDEVADGNGAGVVVEDVGRQHAGGEVLHLAVDE